MQVARERVHSPTHVDTQQVAERAYNIETGTYGQEQGNLYTVNRHMPVPYNMTLQVDIWTTNTDTKLSTLQHCRLQCLFGLVRLLRLRSKLSYNELSQTYTKYRL